MINGAEDPVHFALGKGRYQASVDPQWRKGISGKSLWFDGYSTYIRRAAADIAKPVDALTITAWVAPAAYDLGAEQRLSAIVNQHDREARQGYILGLYRHGTWSLQLGFGDEWVEVWSLEHTIPLHKWSFVAATYDKACGELKLYLNGTEAAVRKVGAAADITPFGGDLLIGRNNKGMILAESFTMNHFGGLLDELVIYNRALSAVDIADAFQAYIEPHGGAIPELPAADPVRLRRLRADDRHRPQYHLSPPAHWMNEPHGPLYFNGQYHLFYQYNPQGPFWHHIHWGHWVSEDLAHWRDLPPALYPEAGFDPDGIWSGSACLDGNGNPVLFYTAGDFSTFPTQTIGLARSTFPLDGDNDLKDWVKHPEPIIVQGKGVGLYGEFRDPFVWEEDGIWYMLVGSGTGEAGDGGTALVYTSSGDLTGWTYRGPLYVSDYAKYPFLGIAWELPVLLPLRNVEGRETGKHVFLICPWGEGAKVEVNYWIGVWNRESCRFIPDREEPGLIDVGDFHFTGPSGMVDPITGRSLLFTIAQGERTPEIDYDCGWSHGAGMPVSLYLRPDGQLGIEPIEEARQLRGSKLLEAEGGLDEINAKLAGIQGDMLEIRLRFEAASARKYGVSLRRSPGGEEETIVYYDGEREWLAVNREKSTLDAAERIGGIQGGSLKLGGEALNLTIYIDRSLIECYANGIGSLTTRTYPSRPDALGLALWSDGPVERAAIEIWEMTPAFQTENQTTMGS
ncbi:MAG TPA: GH32 C-terminal domain-containing protein [Paenibacillus sp.]|uniref:GH32 C-terminal domain-containing protein n=1 Tax=Paenibacillus sp. TaxID=58172 RepID=UPI002C803C15|nr:GH32 C-terminal domain-containing protein [Paenibacillus sp.]HUC92901.1 GH32 C-terminal domain-containing protein [Paenibacillus sp.]